MAKPKIVDRDLGWKELLQRTREVKNSYVEVGIFDSGKGAEDRGGGLTNAELGTIHEFGTDDGRIPSRSFARSTFDEKRQELINLGQKLIGAVVGGAMETKSALDILGATLATEMKKKITTGPPLPPPLAASTMKRKDPNREFRIAKAESRLGAAQRGQSRAEARQQERALAIKDRNDRANERLGKAKNRLKKRSRKITTALSKRWKFHKAKQRHAKAMERSERATARDAAAVGRAIRGVEKAQSQLERASVTARPLVDTGSMVNSITWVSHVRGKAE